MQKTLNSQIIIEMKKQFQYFQQPSLKNNILDETSNSIKCQYFLKDQFLFVKAQNCKKALVNVQLTSKHLSIEFSKNQKQFIDFQLNTIFIEVLYSQPGKTNSSKVELKIYYKTSSITLHSKNQDILLQWINALKDRIFASGFYEIYQPLKKLGQGAFGKVFSIKRKVDGKIFAVKTFQKNKIRQSTKQLKSLFNEISILKTLDHKNTLKYELTYQTNSSIWIVFQILNGQDLHKKIKYSSISKSQVKVIMRGILKGLIYLHKNGIIHRDLKPQNIMMRNKSTLEPVIVDFGLSTNLQNYQQLSLCCGTPGYMAPQILKTKNNTDKISTKSDMFSLGAIFHLLLTDLPLFKGKNGLQIYKKNQSMDFDLNSKFCNKTDAIAMDLLKKMLEINPLKRISAQQALQHKYFAEQKYSTSFQNAQQKENNMLFDNSQSQKYFSEI